MFSQLPRSRLFETMHLGLEDLIELELVADVTAVVVERPAAALEALDATRFVDHAVNSDELSYYQFVHACSFQLGLGIAFEDVPGAVGRDIHRDRARSLTSPAHRQDCEARPPDGRAARLRVPDSAQSPSTRSDWSARRPFSYIPPLPLDRRCFKAQSSSGPDAS